MYICMYICRYIYIYTYIYIFILIVFAAKLRNSGSILAPIAYVAVRFTAFGSALRN